MATRRVMTSVTSSRSNSLVVVLVTVFTVPGLRGIAVPPPYSNIPVTGILGGSELLTKVPMEEVGHTGTLVEIDLGSSE